MAGGGGGGGGLVIIVQNSCFRKKAFRADCLKNRKEKASQQSS